MASSAARLKFPGSRFIAFSASAGTESASGGPALTPAAAEIAAHQKAHVAAADETAAAIEETEAAIAGMLARRDMLRADMERLSAAACEKCCMYAEAAYAVEQDFCRDGFAAESVRAAVARIRGAFFDDSDPEFRRISCINFSVSRERGDEHAAFTFERDDGRSFRLTVPVLRQQETGPFSGFEPYGDRVYVNGAYSDDPRRVNVRGFSLVHPYGLNNCVTAAFHYDIRAMRRFVSEYVKAGLEPPGWAEFRKREETAYREYSGVVGCNWARMIRRLDAAALEEKWK